MRRKKPKREVVGEQWPPPPMPTIPRERPVTKFNEEHPLKIVKRR